MKAQTRIKLILVFAVAMVAALIGGCSIGMPTYEETIEQYDLTSLVTYYGNGGYFDSSTAILYRLIGYKTGAAYYDIQDTGTSTTVAHSTGWVFDGWYYVKTVEITSEDGEAEVYYVCEDDTDTSKYTITEDGETRFAVTTYEGQYVISQTDYEYMLRYATIASALPMLQLGDAMDSTMTMQAGHIYLAAKWVVDYAVEYKLVMRDGGTKVTYSLTTTEENEEGEKEDIVTDYEAFIGDTLYTNYFGHNSSLSILTSSPLTTADSSCEMINGTWLEFYYDEACTQPVPSTATFTKPESENITIYALYTPGLWTVVKDTSGVKSIFNSTSGSYYVFNDVDCTGVSVSPASTFAGTINGNGYTISNLTITSSNISSGNNAAFGTLRNGANIYNVTFDNLTATYTTRAAVGSTTYTPYIYLLFAGVNGTVSISNVSVTNSTLNLTVENGVTIMNVQSESDYDSWLYTVSRGDGETDGDFEAVYGITVTDCCLVFKRNQGQDEDNYYYYKTTTRDSGGNVLGCYYSWSGIYDDYGDGLVYDKISELDTTDLSTAVSTYYLYEGYYTDANGVVYDKRIEIDGNGEAGSAYYTYYDSEGALQTTSTDPKTT